MSHVISNGFNESCLATGGVSCCDLWLAFSLTILGLEVWINIFAKKNVSPNIVENNNSHVFDAQHL